MPGAPKISAVGLFCEDIREERSGQDTLIGILPDNLQLEQPPAPGVPVARILPRLCIYMRINIDPSFDPGPVTTRLIYPNGEELNFGPLDPALIKKTRDAALEENKPLAGFISKVVLGNFNTKSEGRIRLVLSAGGDDYLCGSLNIKLIAPTSSASASAPPPAQSPAAASAKGS